MLALAATLASATAPAHTLGTSRSDIELQAGGRVRVVASFFRAERFGALLLDADRNGVVVEAERARKDADLRAFFAEGFDVTADGVRCVCGAVESHLDDGDGLIFGATFLCPTMPRRLGVTAYFLGEFAASHRHLAMLRAGTDVTQRVLVRTQRFATIDVPTALRPPETPWFARSRLVYLLLAVAAALGVVTLVWRRGATSA